MIKLNFYIPLTAHEIRDPSVEVCRDVAEKFDLHVTFHQPQQRALAGSPSDRRSTRERIGNGKHYDWFIDFQEEEPKVSKPTVVGMIALKAPIRPDDMEYGGFDYGEFGEVAPTYSFIEVRDSGFDISTNRNLDILEMTYKGLSEQFATDRPRLFDIGEYTS